MKIALQIAMGLGTDREDAADIAQEVALDVLRSLKQLRHPKAFDAWVRKIAVRHVMRALAAQRRRVAADGRLDGADEHKVPADVVDRDMLIASRAVLTDALASLPARQAVALVLRYVYDLTDREIADALGCRRGTANALLSRGRAALREVSALQDLASTMEIAS